MSLIDVENLRVSFDTEDGELIAVRDVSFSVGEAETFGIVGESGSGKSVSAQALVGLVPGARVSGRAMFDGRNLIGMSERQLRSIRGARIGLVFQDPLSSLHPHFRVGRQIVEAIQAHERISDSAAKARTIELLATVGLGQPDRRFDDYPHQFSGGMRQRVCSAMAIACTPRLLIADEPTSNLDVTIQVQMMELFRDIQRETGVGIILITHDLGVAAGICHRIAVMYAGPGGGDGRRTHRLPPAGTPLHARPARLHSAPAARRPLYSIAGQPPSLIALGPGCVFRARCAHAMPQCIEEPPVRTIGPDHESRCWLPATDVAHRSAVVPGMRGSAESEAGRGEALLTLTDVVKHFPLRSGC